MKTQLRQSRWVKIPALLSSEGVRALFEHLGDFVLARTGALLAPNELFVSKEAFLEVYTDYITALEEAREPDLKAARPFFSTTWSSNRSSFELEEVRPGSVLARIKEPSVQLRLHQLSYSPLDHTFHSMSLGKETISWGIQFAFASLVQEGHDVKNVDRNSPNATFFREIQRWMRHETAPVTFQGAGWQRRTAIRMSPECHEWIVKHPHLSDMEVAR